MTTRPILERLLNKFTVGDDCWLWKSAAERDTYPGFWIDGKVVKAYRVVYELLVGPIPDDLELDHTCRRHACVNPGHLEPVTHQVNLQRAVGHGTWAPRKTHCPKGHAYDAENTHLRPDGSRRCRACGRDEARAYYWRKKVAS